MKPPSITLGFELATGNTVDIPLAHMAVTGMTQASGKTTTLEALVSRAPGAKLAFITKRGESAFVGARRIRPYFRDRADWQFVTALLEATLAEKNKFLRPWIMKVCRTTRTLADVHLAVKAALTTAKGINEGVYTQLDAYLELIVPEIAKADLAAELDLQDDLAVMDLATYPLPLQMLFIQSALDFVNEHATDTIVILPEAWEMIPEGKNTPVKASAVSLIRKGAALRNLLWIDSQDMAGVDKVMLRGCSVWLIGVQREANEIKRNLANIPAGIAHPKPNQIALLSRGEFYACWKGHAIPTYVQPAWMHVIDAHEIAKGLSTIEELYPAGPPRPVPPPTTIEDTVNQKEADALMKENARLKAEVLTLSQRLERLNAHPAEASEATASRSTITIEELTEFTEEARAKLYTYIKARLVAEAPHVLRVATMKPEIVVEVERKTITIDGSTMKGRVAQLLAKGFFKEPRTQGATRSELKRTGPDVNSGHLSTLFASLLKEGFLTLDGNLYSEAPGMLARVVDK